VARQVYFSITDSRRRPARDLSALLQRSQLVQDALASESVGDLEPMVWTMLSLFPAAVEVLANASSDTRMMRVHRETNRTLPAAGAGGIRHNGERARTR
jgi:hypothetical protein